MREDKTENKQEEIDGLAKLRAYRQANPDDEDIASKRWRMVRRLLLILVVCAVIIYGAKLGQSAWLHIHQQRFLNETTAQVAQLVENIRQLHARENNPQQISAKMLITAHAVPAPMLKAGEIHHPFAGRIVIEPSWPLEMEQGVMLETFKMSLQNLSHQTCVALAQINWGTAEQGLQAVAVGLLDDKGNDTALRDVDYRTREPEIVKVQDENGQWQTVALPLQYMLYVANPQKNSSDALFGENEAIFGCRCGNQKRCSLALRYTF